MKYYIYALVDPRNGNPFYIGCTINPKQRLSQHQNTKYDSAKENLVREIKRAGLKPQMRILETLDERRLKSGFVEEESIWIETLSHFRLLNQIMPIELRPFSKTNSNLQERTRDLNKGYRLYEITKDYESWGIEMDTLDFLRSTLGLVK